MIQGYSVPEAASVLGVPEGKVWELLARGVLSGATEGESMRVFLKADAPHASQAEHGQPHRGNGNGGAGAVEASPFRELLTEFRNLTERYGQALLALGEARGEVAGLRSRVELLEARLDLRLPGPGLVPPVAWERPEPVARLEEEEPDEVAAAAAPAESAEEAKPTRGRKARNARSAVAGFAEALARAQDPSTATVTGGQVGEAPAEPSEEVAAEAVAPPEPVQPAEAVQPALEPEPPLSATYSTEVVEPDWFADGDFAWLDAAEVEARAASAAVEEPAAVEESAPTPEALIERAWEPEAAAPEDEMETAPSGWREPEPATESFVEPGMFEPGPAEDDLSRLAREEGWDESEVEAIRALVRQGEAAEITLPGADELDEALAAMQAPIAEPEPVEAETPSDEWPVADREWSKAPVPIVVEDQSLEAADEPHEEPAHAHSEPPYEAIEEAAPEAVPEAPPVEPHAEPTAYAWERPPAEPATPAPEPWSEPIEEPLSATAPEPLPARAPAPRTPPMPFRQAAEPTADPAWLRRRRGPAAEAYRRLRRLFTG